MPKTHTSVKAAMIDSSFSNPHVLCSEIMTRAIVGVRYEGLGFVNAFPFGMFNNLLNCLFLEVFDDALDHRLQIVFGPKPNKVVDFINVRAAPLHILEAGPIGLFVGDVVDF